MLRPDVRLTGAGEDPHVEGFVDIEGGGFGCRRPACRITGSTRRIALSPDRITIPNLQIVDEEGQPLTISGSLGVHAREVGAVDVTISSRNFELIDNELGDVGVETHLKITGELRRPKIVGDVKLQSARLEVDKILAFFYDPYAVHGAARRRVRRAQHRPAAAGAEDATRQALAHRPQASARRRRRRQQPPRHGGACAARPARSRRSSWTSTSQIPENLVLRGKDLRPGGPTGAALGDLNITVGGDLDITKAPDAPITLLGAVDTVRGTYEFQGRRFDLVRGGTLRSSASRTSTRTSTSPPTRDDPEHRRRGARSTSPARPSTPQLELTSDPPLDEADILSLIVFNRPVNELGIRGERRRWRRRPAASPAASSPSPLGNSIGQALDLDLFEITTTTDDGRARRGRHARQADQRPGVLQLRQQFGERSSPSSCSSTSSRFPARRGDRSRRRRAARQPPRPAPHRARRHRSDLLLLVFASGFTVNRDRAS